MYTEKKRKNTKKDKNKNKKGKKNWINKRRKQMKQNICSVRRSSPEGTERLLFVGTFIAGWSLYNTTDNVGTTIWYSHGMVLWWHYIAIVRYIDGVHDIVINRNITWSCKVVSKCYHVNSLQYTYCTTYLRNGADDQRVHPHLGIIGLLLAEPGVDDVVDAVNRQRSLRDVRRYHHLKSNNRDGGVTWGLGKSMTVSWLLWPHWK